MAGTLALLCCAGMVAPRPHAARAAPDAVPLQPLIDAASPGQTLVLSGDRVYAGPAVVSDPITISSDGEAVVTNGSDRPALMLAADGIVIRGISVQDGQTDPKKPAILVQSDGNRLERLRIKSQGGGIFLRQANDNLILDSRIEGAHPDDPDEPYSRRGNGIDLLASARNVIEGNTIVHVHDGVYAESSNETRVRGNVATDSRYGYHFMFSAGSELTDNVGEGNVTGGMVMAVEGAVVKGNRFEKQTENVNSQGILLFDVHRSEISGNRVVGNRVGLYVERSTDNKLAGNEIVRNFIGMQMIQSDGNRLQGSLFAANVNQAQSTDSKDNVLEGNYWDDFEALDADGDGRSDLSYEIDPFFLRLTEDIEAFQVFFQSPGLPFLAQMFRADTANWLRDSSPLLEPPLESPETGDAASGRRTWLPGVLLLLAALTIIYRWGYKKS